VTDPTDIQGGAATIMGSVTGPQGAVTGATVRVQRTVGTQTTTMDLTSSGGLFNLQAVRGGAYEVQAWKQPDLLLTTPQTFFLGATEVKTLSLPLTLISAVNARTTVTPSPPPAQSPFTITVLLYAGSVGGQGTLLATPRANQPVTFQPGNGLSLQSSGQASTDSGGNASFSVQCVVPGPPSANLMVSTLKIALVDLPPCPSS
jgi:hypothetical protein